MHSDRTLRLFAFFAFAASLAIGTSAQAIVVCRTPDGATYATDHPPPDCAPIPSSEIERFGAYSESEEAAPAAPPPAPPPVVREAPAYAPEPPPRREARDMEDSPESNRAHAMASCEQSVAEQLERPSSARWPNRGDYKVRESGGRYFVEGHVEAEQALGSSDIKWRCDAINTGDRWIAVAELEKEAPPPPVAAAPAPASYPPAESPPPAPADSIPVSRAMPPQSNPAPPPSYPAPPPSYPAPAPDAAPAPDLAPPPAAAPPPAGEPIASVPTAEHWKERSSCPGMKFDASTEKHANEGFQIVGGQITYTGRPPVKDVRVCASGICQMVRQEPMTQGASEKFSIKMQSLETPVVTAQCSVLIE